MIKYIAVLLVGIGFLAMAKYISKYLERFDFDKYEGDDW